MHYVLSLQLARSLALSVCSKVPLCLFDHLFQYTHKKIYRAIYFTYDCLKAIFSMTLVLKKICMINNTHTIFLNPQIRCVNVWLIKWKCIKYEWRRTTWNNQKHELTNKKMIENVMCSVIYFVEILMIYSKIKYDCRSHFISLKCL